jgi:hypothetical protein
LRGVPRACLARRGMSPSTRRIFGQEPDPSNGLCTDDARGLPPRGKGRLSSPTFWSPECTGWPAVKAESTATLGTSDSYVASTLKMFSSRSYTSLITSISRQGRVGLASAEPDPPSGAKKGEPLRVEIGCTFPHQKISIQKGLLRSPGYVKSRVPRNERGYM